MQVDLFHFFVANLFAFLVGVFIQSGFDLHASFGFCVSDEADDGGMIYQGTPPPVLGNKTKHTVFYLVPFAGSRWKVRDMDGEIQFVGKLL